MRQDQFAQALIESGAPPKVGVEVDRLLLRLHSAPGLLGYLYGTKFKDGKLELDFLDLPAEARVGLIKLIGPFKTEGFQYSVGGHPHIGFRIEVVALDQKPDQAVAAPASSARQ